MLVLLDRSAWLRCENPSARGVPTPKLLGCGGICCPDTGHLHMAVFTIWTVRYPWLSMSHGPTNQLQPHRSHSSCRINWVLRASCAAARPGRPRHWCGGTGAAEHRHHGFHHGAGDVVLCALGGQAPTGGLAVHAQRPCLWVCHAEGGGHFGPKQPGCAQLGDDSSQTK